MPRLRALRKKEDIEAVPLDQPVEIDTAGAEEEERNERIQAEKGGEGKEHKTPAKAEVQPEKEEIDSDEVSALRKQLEELQKAERDRANQAALAEQQRQDAIRRAEESEAQVVQHRSAAEDAQYDAILNAINAAQAEAEAAQRDYTAAVANQEFDKQAEAQRKMARAEARLDRLEEGKEAFEERRKALKDKPVERRAPADPFEAQIAPLPDPAKVWLRNHRDYMTDQRKNAKIQALHWDVMDEGHEAFSKEYFESLEVHLGLRQKPAKKDEEREDEKDPSIVSAPVSRDTPSMSSGRPTSTRVRLSPAQREAAKMAGVDEITYAKNLLKMEQLKKEGHYQGDR